VYCAASVGAGPGFAATQPAATTATARDLETILMIEEEVDRSSLLESKELKGEEVRSKIDGLKFCSCLIADVGEAKSWCPYTGECGS
jgi:hypothetical protein